MGKLMVGAARVLLLCAVVLVLPALAAAFPIAAPGTEGFELSVQSTDPVVATYQGNSALYSNDLYLVLDGSSNPGDDGNPANDKFIFNNHASPIGSMVELGSFPIGTKLIFRLHVNDTNTDYYTGPGSRNPDGQPHARSQANWLPNETLVSFEDLLNGPFHYNDLSFSFANTVGACNPALREPCNSNAQPVYSREIPQGLAPNLIVIVHGCCTDENDLDEWRKVKSSIEKAISQNQTPGAWEIVVWNWTDVTKSIIPGLIPGLPDVAYLGATPHGQYLGKEIVNPSAKPGWQYNYVHFIAHSAGSRLIHESAKYIKTKDGTPPFIHSTFLDAYCHPPFPLVDATFYAFYSDYAEQYVDRGLPLTDLYLWAYNFDITDLDKNPIGTRFPYEWPNDFIQQYHFWPVAWYQQSIDSAGDYRFGFPLSFEYNRNIESPSSFYDRQEQNLQSQWNISAGDACVLTSNTACRRPGPVALPPPIVDYTRLISSWITGGAGAIQTSITGVVETVDDNVRGWLATLFTGSPVWFEAPITTTQTFHLIKFDYEFLSAAGAQGILTVFVDDQLVYTIDERITDPGVNTAQAIPVGELAPGNHTIGFRLDPYTTVQSVVEISNIEFGEVGNNPDSDIVYLSFVEGSPGIPGEGIIVSSVGGSNDEEFQVQSPYSLAGIANGLTLSVFLPSNIPITDLTTQLNFQVNFSVAGKPPTACDPSTVFVSELYAVNVNGVQGVAQNVSQQELDDVVNFVRTLPPPTWDCADVTLDDFSLHSFRLSNKLTEEVVREIDALAVGIGQNAIPTETTPPPE